MKTIFFICDECDLYFTGYDEGEYFCDCCGKECRKATEKETDEFTEALIDIYALSKD